MTTSSLASELDSLLSGSGQTSSASASALASELASLLSNGSIGTTTSTSGSALTSALDSLLASGVNSITGTTSITGATGVLPGSSLTFIPITTFNSPINASPLPFNGTLPFTRTPANPSPVPTIME